ncbi:bifunctional riboflavin kinase/FAD synthetase [Aquihabitans sp. G128]|uniref:bifunctional riboflavin kinase/FAD synthetase n=1 Tax=Aquihabitans sp. G128 TaxID=2849779 RepID=UPI001C22E628|nr:bifunctional riboflavin kinase/FAD synthetase [Aquihabitans sp. G128]QXC62444.1 bifunctional riboflavin kinase/FAD synthetase [Aquihabitans sp. G128]
MQVIHGSGPCPTPMDPSVVTIGAYDGVHLGHQVVIGQVRQLAAARGLQTVVVTFDRHPATVVRPESAPRLLCDLDQKLELLAATGVDATYVIRFDAERAAETAEEFVDDVLVGCLSARAVVVGEDFHFGHKRGGDVALLHEMGATRGFTVEGLGLVGPDGVEAVENVSSTAIRKRLIDGDVAAAAALLGRPHEVRGTVEHGDKRGRELGFPTANLVIPDEIQLPADGIYAGWFERADGTVHATAMSLGHRPTFYDRPQGAPLLECNLLDFAGDLYGEAVKVRFVQRLRGEVRFDGVEPLVAQMQADVAQTRALLAT